MNLYRWSGKKEEKENRNHCPRFERETYTLVFPYIFHGKLEAMIRSRATCLTSSTLSPNSKDFTSALNKLWNVPPPRSLASFFCSPLPPSTPLPTRGLYILEFCKRKNTPRDTIRNGSVIDTFLFFFFSISKKESLKIRIREGKTKIEIWLNTLCCCWFYFLRKKYPDQKNVSRIRIFKELLFLCVQILFELDEILFFPQQVVYFV